MSTVFIVSACCSSRTAASALGTNIMLMGVTTVAVGWLVFRARSSWPAKGCRWCRQPPASPPSSRCRWLRSFVLLYAVGGTADIPIDSLATAMVGVHLLIGVGEA